MPIDPEILRSAWELHRACKIAKEADKKKARTLRRRAPLGLTGDMLPRKPNSRPSPYRGVSWNRRDSLWVARIKVKGKSIHLGVFIPDKVKDAAVAYDIAAWLYFGPSAVRNFDDSPKRQTIYVQPPPKEKESAPEGIRVCARCNLPKPFSEFWREPRRPPFFRRYSCISCCSRLAKRPHCVAEPMENRR